MSIYSRWVVMACCFLLTLAYQVTAMAAGSKIIVVHARGIAYPDMIDHIKSASPEDFFNRKQSAGHLKKLEPITSAVTISNIASYETGLPPAGHGIVGHAYAIDQNDELRAVSGFAQRFEQETFWEQADRAGYSVLKVGDLTLHGKYGTHRDAHVLGQGTQKTNAELIQLVPSGEGADENITRLEMQGPEAGSGSPSERWANIRFYQLKASDAYLYLDQDYNKDNGFLAKVGRGEWFEFRSKSPEGEDQAYRITWQGASDSLSIYVRPTYASRGYPAEFSDLINRELGPPKGWPNIPFFRSGKIGASQLMDEIDSETSYVLDAFALAAKHRDYDLVMIDYPVMDRIGHAWLGMRDSSAEIRDHYASAFERMSRDFSKIERYALDHGYALVISSGHGFSPTHTSVDLSTLLDTFGFRGGPETADWEVVGVPGKVSAHVYINKEIDHLARGEVLKRLQARFADFTHPESKERLFDGVYDKNTQIEIGVSHQHSGDLFVLLKPGFVFAENEGQLFGEAVFSGDHGYSVKHEESFGVLIGNSACDRCRSVDVAGLVRQRLGLDASAGVE